MRRGVERQQRLEVVDGFGFRHRSQYKIRIRSRRELLNTYSTGSKMLRFKPCSVNNASEAAHDLAAIRPRTRFLPAPLPCLLALLVRRRRAILEHFSAACDDATDVFSDVHRHPPPCECDLIKSTKALSAAGIWRRLL
jgi:hypothetical protein